MSVQKLHIEITSDFNCPWCEVGRSRLDAALRSVPSSISYEVIWKPYFLYPIPEGGVPWGVHMKDYWGFLFYFISKIFVPSILHTQVPHNPAGTYPWQKK